MTKENTTYRYDNQKKILHKTQTVELKDPSTDSDVGVRKYIDEYNESGIRGLIKALNEQKTQFEQNLKEVKNKLLALEAVEVDEEFLAKMEAFKKMQDKKNFQQNKEGLEQALKDINWELQQVRGVGAVKK